MSVIDYFKEGALIGLAASLSPGPFQSLIIAQSLAGGWRRAAPATFAPLIADIPIALAIILILGEATSDFLQAVMFAGAALLIYLAWGLWREMRKAPTSAATENAVVPQSALRGLFQGVLMIFLSPGPYLFWASVLGPVVVEGLKTSLAHGVAFLLGFYIFSIALLQLMALILGRVGEVSPQLRRGLQTASLVLMLVIAALLVQRGLAA